MKTYFIALAAIMGCGGAQGVEPWMYSEPSAKPFPGAQEANLARSVTYKQEGNALPDGQKCTASLYKGTIDNKVRYLRFEKTCHPVWDRADSTTYEEYADVNGDGIADRHCVSTREYVEEDYKRQPLSQSILGRLHCNSTPTTRIEEILYDWEDKLNEF